MVNQGRITWLDYTIMSNPAGVMKVLSDYGFTGYMAPQSEAQMRASAIEIMDLDGEEGIIAIMKAHPEYAEFKDLFQKESRKFSNAIGETISDRISAWVYRNPVNQGLVALAIFVAGYYIISAIRK